MIAAPIRIGMSNASPNRTMPSPTESGRRRKSNGTTKLASAAAIARVTQ